jgi:hypothetical protein
MSPDAAYIHNPAVDVTEFLEAEEPCAMGRIIECVGLLATRESVRYTRSYRSYY